MSHPCWSALATNWAQHQNQISKPGSLIWHIGVWGNVSIAGGNTCPIDCTVIVFFVTNNIYECIVTLCSLCLPPFISALCVRFWDNIIPWVVLLSPQMKCLKCIISPTLHFVLHRYTCASVYALSYFKWTWKHADWLDSSWHCIRCRSSALLFCVFHSMKEWGRLFHGRVFVERFFEVKYVYSSI